MQQLKSKAGLVEQVFQHIVLGGGGSKGIGHLGALKSLKARNQLLKVKSYGGTSAGAMVSYNMALGMPHEFLMHFMGIPTVDKDMQRVLKGLEPTNLQSIVRRSEKPTYFPTGMPDLAFTMLTYGMLGGDPLHTEDALAFEHPIVLEQLRLLDTYKEYVKSNTRNLEKVIDRREVARLLDVLENIEHITLGEWGAFVDSLNPLDREYTGIAHFSCSASQISDTQISPITFTSILDTEFTEASREVPMILAMAASASFPWALPPVNIEALGIVCMDGGIFQNLPYIKKIYKEEETLAINLGHQPVQRAWDNGVFYNFGELKRIGMATMFGKELYIPELYFDCVHGFPINQKICVLGLSELAISSEEEVIETLTSAPTIEQLVAFYTGSSSYVDRVIEEGFLSTGNTVVDFVGTDYGNFMKALRISGIDY